MSAKSAFGVSLGNVFFSNDFSNCTSSGSSTDLDDLSGELKSGDGDNLSLDGLAINKDSFIRDDIENGS